MPSSPRRIDEPLRRRGMWSPRRASTSRSSPTSGLREREFGILDLLTHRGVVAAFPDEAKRRDRLGKFYYRPPGGESWVDVALRLRSLRDSLVREHADRRVLVVTHEVPIIITRYLIERLDESTALDISRSGQLANCSLTTYDRDRAGSVCDCITTPGSPRWKPVPRR